MKYHKISALYVHQVIAALEACTEYLPNISMRIKIEELIRRIGTVKTDVLAEGSLMIGPELHIYGSLEALNLVGKSVYWYQEAQAEGAILINQDKLESMFTGYVPEHILKDKMVKLFGEREGNLPPMGEDESKGAK